jgi:CP family cyanate transporter-like MFS transporter
VRPPQAAAESGATSRVTAGLAGGAVLAVVGLVLVAFNQRPAVASVPPVLHELGLGLTGESILVTIPVFCFGLGALAGPHIRRAVGQEWAVFLLMAVLAAAVAVRAAFLGWTLFPATVVVGLCIANLNVLMPAFVKQRFPDRPGPLTSAYVASATLGPALAAGLTVPVFHAFGGSVNAALGIWTLPALLALVAWSPQLWVARRLKAAGFEGATPGGLAVARDGSGASVAAAGVGGSAPARSLPGKPIWRHSLAWQVMVYMGIGSLVFYGPLSWLSQIYQSRGVDAATAGYLLLVMNFVGMIGSAAAPLLVRRRRDVRLGVAVFAVITLVGFVGLLAGPNGVAFFWMAVLGFGQGGQFGLALLLIVIRAGDDKVAARLSGMSQSGGYLIAALGPLVMGGLHSLTAGWLMPILFLVIANFFGLAMGYRAAKERVIPA